MRFGISLMIIVCAMISMAMLYSGAEGEPHQHCNHHEHEGGEVKYPATYTQNNGTVTYLNDSIVVVRTRIKGLDNYETTIVNIKNVSNDFNTGERRDDGFQK